MQGGWFEFLRVLAFEVADAGVSSHIVTKEVTFTDLGVVLVDEALGIRL